MIPVTSNAIPVKTKPIGFDFNAVLKAWVAAVASLVTDISEIIATFFATISVINLFTAAEVAITESLYTTKAATSALITAIPNFVCVNRFVNQPITEPSTEINPPTVLTTKPIAVPTGVSASINVPNQLTTAVPHS